MIPVSRYVEGGICQNSYFISQLYSSSLHPLFTTGMSSPAFLSYDYDARLVVSYGGIIMVQTSACEISHIYVEFQSYCLVAICSWTSYLIFLSCVLICRVWLIIVIYFIGFLCELK
jgi:hypothetical protein